MIGLSLQIGSVEDLLEGLDDADVDSVQLLLDAAEEHDQADDVVQELRALHPTT